MSLAEVGRRSFAVVGVLCLMSLYVPVFGAFVDGAQCMQGLYMNAGGTQALTCTAGEVVAFMASNVQVNDDGCAFAGDTVDLTFDLAIELNAMGMNPARYDIGIYLAQDGGDALNGTCRVETPPAPPAVDLDMDACGDINDSVEPFMHRLSNVVVICNDSDLDGFLDVGICTAWKQVDSACNGPLAAVPGAPSKCDCTENFALPIEVPGTCGDGVVTPGESCDPPGVPAGANGNVCRPDCTVCGDGIVDAAETCDDGNGVDGDGCENDCTLTPFCGDGVVNFPGESCDPPGAPAGGNGNLCRADCTVCGDGVVDAVEECDDGNGVGADGCENDCTITAPFCGDGVVNVPGESCDPPGDPAGGNGNLCRADCTVCGDGIVDAGEACDDGNGLDGDGCNNDCTFPPFCGDGVIDPGETCDPPGSTVGISVCRGDCTYCGDGIVDAVEACDDGNVTGGDGCEPDCTLSSFDGACCTDGAGTASECIDGVTEDECVSDGGYFLGVGVDCSMVDSCTALLVRMESMSATATEAGVLVRWVTASEVDTIGFRVLRAGAAGIRKKTLTVVAEMIPSSGHGLTGASYFVLDDSRDSRRASSYFIEDIDILGRVTRHGPIAIDRGRRAVRMPSGPTP